MASSLLHYDKAEVLDALRSQRARTVALLESLAPARWETIALPGWRVREVAAHLVSTDEAALTGRLLRLGVRQRPIADIEAWNETQVGRWADRPVPALLHALERWGRRFARAYAVQPSWLARRTVPSPFGTVSLLWLAMLRVYDEWVHAEDVRRAVKAPSDDAAASVTPAARHLLATLPLQTLPRVSAAASGRVSLAFEDVDLPVVGIDFDARRYGAGLADGGTRVVARAAPLVMVAAGRDAWRDAEAAGTLRVEGDRDAAETLLDALLVV